MLSASSRSLPIMEEPNAQSVGREFVRQYYTMMHEAPDFLHRFYSHNSSFVHGGVEKPGEELEPAIGQNEINKKISQLEFRDCHAKIRQVDSQSSIEGAVVIQVIGELSNSGAPMRRFIQTFVLAPQSPKKYYLHNDIFRYQDEVFQDVSADVDGPTEEEEAAQIYEHRLAETSDVKSTSVPVEEEELEDRQVQMSYYEPAATVSQLVVASVVSNGAGIHEEGSSDAGYLESVHGDEGQVVEPVPVQVTDGPETESVGEEVEEEQGGDAGLDEAVTDETEAVEHDVDVTLVEETTNAAKVADSALPPQEPQPVVPVQKPTWAAMASRNASAPVTSTAPVSKPQATIRPEPKTAVAQRGPVPNGGGLPQRLPRTTTPSAPACEASSLGGREAGSTATPVNNTEGAPTRSTGSAAVENGRGGFEGARETGEDGSRRPGGPPQPSLYPDTHQVFVGNVPHFVVDMELKEFFEQYGPVADIRINRSKTNNNLPNFGFVSFESADTVQNLLSTRPLPKLHGKHRLNVEEKKAKEELTRPRSSGARPPAQLGNKDPSPFGRQGDSYAPSAGRGRGVFNSNRAAGGASQNNGGAGGGNYQGGAGTNNVGKGYNKGYTSDEGHAPAGAAAAPPSAQNNPR